MPHKENARVEVRMKQENLAAELRLLTAAACGRTLDIAEELARGANPSARDDLGRTPLILAAEAGSMGAVRLLLTAGAVADERDLSGENALGKAVKSRKANWGLVGLLVESVKGEIKEEDSALDKELLEACKAGDALAVRNALQKGADPVSPAWIERKPLGLSIESGSVKCVELVLKAGASATDRNTYGGIPLRSAASSASIEIVKVLIRNGANPSALEEECPHVNLIADALDARGTDAKAAVMVKYLGTVGAGLDKDRLLSAAHSAIRKDWVYSLAAVLELAGPEIPKRWRNALSKNISARAAASCKAWMLSRDERNALHKQGKGGEAVGTLESKRAPRI